MILKLTSLCYDSSVCCQCDTARICCCDAIAAELLHMLHGTIDRYLICCRALSSKLPHTTAAVDLWDKQKTEGRMLNCFIDLAVHTVWAVSVNHVAC